MPKPPEPISLKTMARGIMDRDPAAAKATPHSGADPLARIYGNRLPKYLWGKAGWGEQLMARGVALEAFLRVVGNKRRHFIRWVKDEATWEEYLEALAKGVAQ